MQQKMKLPIIDTKKTETGRIEMPVQFSEKIRPDLVKRAVLVINANSRQPYGAHPDAGKRASAELSRRRHKYRGSYGSGISRVPRKILSRRGTRMNWVGAFAPGTVKGRRAHPPKAEKIWSRKINKAERRKAIRSAMAATMVRELVKERGHQVPENYPFIIDNDIEKISKTKDLRDILDKLGLKDELQRTSVRKVRHGKGKMRGRKYKTKKGPLIVVSEKCSVMNAGRNISGVNVILANKLNAGALAPNATLGRLCLYTRSAVEKLGRESLFLDTERPKKPKDKDDNAAKKGRSSSAAGNSAAGNSAAGNEMKADKKKAVVKNAGLHANKNAGAGSEK